MVCADLSTHTTVIAVLSHRFSLCREVLYAGQSTQSRATQNSVSGRCRCSGAEGAECSNGVLTTPFIGFFLTCRMDGSDEQCSGIPFRVDCGEHGGSSTVASMGFLLCKFFERLGARFNFTTYPTVHYGVSAAPPLGLQSLVQRAALRTTSHLKSLSCGLGDEHGGLCSNSFPSNSFSGEDSDACADMF